MAAKAKGDHESRTLRLMRLAAGESLKTPSSTCSTSGNGLFINCKQPGTRVQQAVWATSGACP